MTDQVPSLHIFGPDDEFAGRCRTFEFGHGITVDEQGDIYIAEMVLTTNMTYMYPLSCEIHFVKGGGFI